MALMSLLVCRGEEGRVGRGRGGALGFAFAVYIYVLDLIFTANFI